MTNTQEILALIALTRVLPYQSQVQRQVLKVAGSATALLEARNHLSDLLPEATSRLLGNLSQLQNHIPRAEEEMAFAERNHIQIITHDSLDYPARMLECPDSPILLYYRGTSDLNNRHILSIVGTRKATEYGRSFCQRFLRQLAELCPDTIIVSGLAYGIDISAHRNALANHLSTIGVLAHGLDQIYPRMHRATAVEMLKQGGLLTEFMSQSTAEKINFVARNRIVAGMSDATLVVESSEKGGSLITAGIAEDYGRDIYAVPGRIGDLASMGCNHLIRNNRAALLLSAEDFVQDMGWVTAGQQNTPIQRELFPQLNPDEMAIFFALKNTEGKHMNQLTVETNLPVGRLSSLLFDMEMRGIVKMLSGGLYKIV